MKFTQDQSESNNMRIIKADEGSNFQQPASTVSRELDQQEEEGMILMREMAASRQMEDAFLVCNASKIKHNVQQWKEEVPLTRPYYGEQVSNEQRKSAHVVNSYLSISSWVFTPSFSQNPSKET